MNNVVKVLFFATFRVATGEKEVILELPDGAYVADLRLKLSSQFPALSKGIGSALVSVNQEFAYDSDRIPGGAEIAIFPPVSGGILNEIPTICQIIDADIDLNQIATAVTLPSTGAVVIFCGTVRAHTRLGRIYDTEYLEYEAYQPMAESKMFQIAEEIRQHWPMVEGIALIQRIGKLNIRVPTVAIACSAAHRDTGVFEAARYGIDRLKEIVPIWKKEVGPNGEKWIEGSYQPKAKD